MDEKRLAKELIEKLEALLKLNDDEANKLAYKIQAYAEEIKRKYPSPDESTNPAFWVASQITPWLDEYKAKDVNTSIAPTDEIIERWIKLLKKFLEK